MTGLSCPPVSEKILVYHAGAAKVDWGNARQVKDYLVGGWRLLNGTRHAFDENQAMALADEEMRRARSLQSMFNHARLTGGEELYGKGNELRLPTLVIHGTEDPVPPFPHGKAIADAIPGARLVTLEGAGHELHRNDWGLVISEMTAHTGHR